MSTTPEYVMISDPTDCPTPKDIVALASRADFAGLALCDELLRTRTFKGAAARDQVRRSRQVLEHLAHSLQEWASEHS